MSPTYLISPEAVNYLRHLLKLEERSPNLLPIAQFLESGRRLAIDRRNYLVLSRVGSGKCRLEMEDEYSVLIFVGIYTTPKHWV